MKKQTQKGMVLPIVLILVVLLVGVFAYSSKRKQETAVTSEVMMDEETKKMMMETEVMEDEMMKTVDDEMTESITSMTYQYQGSLEDVTGGNSSGIARSSFEDGSYSLMATFENLPEPTGSDFYEGWVVRKGAEFSVISTGKVEMTDGKYSNMYSSGQDLTDHTFYVLTIEPDDGDPAPADHILEGTMKEL